MAAGRRVMFASPLRAEEVHVPQGVAAHNAADAVAASDVVAADDIDVAGEKPAVLGRVEAPRLAGFEPAVPEAAERMVACAPDRAWVEAVMDVSRRELKTGQALVSVREVVAAVRSDRVAAWAELAPEFVYEFGPAVPDVRDWFAQDWPHKLSVGAEPALACTALTVRSTFQVSTAQQSGKVSLVLARS